MSIIGVDGCAGVEGCDEMSCLARIGPLPSFTLTCMGSESPDVRRARGIRGVPRLGIAIALLLAAGVARADPTAELIFFTDDGSESGTPLLSGFRHHSVWDGIGATADGQIYVAVSNHLQPGGNAALYHYDPEADQMSLLGDVKSISTAAGNWMPDESQHKVHTYLLQHADGKIYLATDDYDPSPFLRGAHVYTIDPASDQVHDFSQTQPFLMTQDLAVIPNPGLAAEASGVFIEYYGIKGISLNPRVPNLLYAMTYPDGHLIRYDLSDGSMEWIGQSSQVSYIFYVDNIGNVFYTAPDGGTQKLLKYELATENTTTVATGLPDGELGGVAPTLDGETVYVLVANSKSFYRLRPAANELTHIANACGSNWWRLYNLSLSPDERTLYYVSNNNSRSTIRKIDIATGSCSEVLDVNALVGSRDLCFGGVNVWDRRGSFYAPVWTSGSAPLDLAILKVSVESELNHCGDFDLDLAVTAADVAALRAHLADPEGLPTTPVVAARCNVIGSRRPCDVLDLVVLERSLAELGPGIAPVCPAAGGAS